MRGDGRNTCRWCFYGCDWLVWLGSTLGYAAAVAIYEELSTALHDYELAKEERIRVERECAEAVELIRQYRRDMSRDVENYLATHDELFNRAFDAMDQALISNDIDGYLAGTRDSRILGILAKVSDSAGV